MTDRPNRAAPGQVWRDRRTGRIVTVVAAWHGITLRAAVRTQAAARETTLRLNCDGTIKGYDYVGEPKSR